MTTITFEEKSYKPEEFLKLYMEQKQKENDEKEKRTKMEMALLEVFGDSVSEDKTSKSLQLGRYSLTIKRTLSYKLTDKGWEIVNSLPEAERPVDIKYNHTKGKLIPALAMVGIEHETKPTFTVTYK